MVYVIKKGRHRAFPPKLGLWFNKKTIIRNVYFDASCKYNIEGPDMLDTNKLFGIGYFISHHQNSARFGWRYNQDTDKIKLSAYCYVDGERVIVNICDLKIYTWYRLRIDVLTDCYLFEISDAYNAFYKLGQLTVPKSHGKKLSFPLGIYFGGNKAAPRDITIEMKKL